MLPITYRGPKVFITILTRFMGEYSFNNSNNFTVTPTSWEDFYDIMLLNQTPQAREFVLAKDPLININERRIVKDEAGVDANIVKRQLENEERERKANLRISLINKYKTDIMNQIAEGTLNSYPVTLEEDAIAYADKIMLGDSEEDITPQTDENETDENETDEEKELEETTTPQTDDATQGEEETKPGIDGPAIDTISTPQTEGDELDTTKEDSENKLEEIKDTLEDVKEALEEVQTNVDGYIDNKKKKNK